MNTCLCETVCRLASEFNQSQAKDLIPALNAHLRQLQGILAQLRGLGLARDVKYAVTVSNQRADKVLSVDSVDLRPVDRVCAKFRGDPDNFWTPTDDDCVHKELRRRIACVVIFLRSKLEPLATLPPTIANAFHGPQNYIELRHAGRKYLKIARKLGDIGSLFWLPHDIPQSTYERYLNIDDDEIFEHLSSLRPQADQYCEVVRDLVLIQVQVDLKFTYSYYNLSIDHGDLLSPSDLISLLIYSLGGLNIPDALLRGASSPQRRWNSDGEIELSSSGTFGALHDVICVLAKESGPSQVMTNPNIVMSNTSNGTATWSLRPEVLSSIAAALIPEVKAELGILGLKLISFACPPCYVGNTDWSASLKEAIWPLLEKATRASKMPHALKSQVLEATLYFCERDDVAIRHQAVEQSKSLLRKSMPYYLHASVALFQSILHRVDGDVIKSESVIRDFLWKGPKPKTRRDHALRGRLHISQIDNKIKCFDEDVPQLIYDWKAEQPLSSLDVEVTCRLQSAAARFFQSIGNFEAAIESLQQFLSLNRAGPLRANSRRLLVARLADMFCEMRQFASTVEILEPELSIISDSDRRRRPFRRLTLALVEAKIGLGMWDEAWLLLQGLNDVLPPKPDNIHDQQLHIRKIIAEARVTHVTCTDCNQAIQVWKSALQEIGQMYTLKAKNGFCAAIIYLSLAHAQLTQGGDRDGSRHSWATGAEVLSGEKCEFWIPIASTTWLQRIVTEVHQIQGWSLRMMLPGGRPDMIWS